MRLHKGLFISLALMGSSSARANGFVLDIGRARGDTIPDRHEYARSYQNEFFRGKKLEGLQVEASYHLQPRALGRFTSLWFFGLGLVSADIETLYPGGSLTLERSTSFALGGFRLQDENLWGPLIYGAELVLIKGLSGDVELRSPMGQEKQSEEYNIMDLNAPTLAATLGYRATASLLLNTKVRFMTGNVPNIFVGVTYDFASL
jgi:hypothetical protein